MMIVVTFFLNSAKIIMDIIKLSNVHHVHNNIPIIFFIKCCFNIQGMTSLGVLQVGQYSYTL
jgi:hypothetical protein